jgi:hypothetical protein
MTAQKVKQSFRLARPRAEMQVYIQIERNDFALAPKNGPWIVERGSCVDEWLSLCRQSATTFLPRCEPEALIKSATTIAILYGCKTLR